MRFSRLRRHVAVALTVVVAAGLATAAPNPVGATSSFTLTRLAGSDRFETAAAIAQSTFNAGADVVLIARADNFPDALAGNYLAGRQAGPILLTPTERLHETSKSAIQNLRARTAFILGGTGAVGQAVEDELKGMGLTVTRISGDDRYDTAAKVAGASGAGAVGEVNGRKTAVIASGANFPDALAGGPLSYAGALPTLLTEPTFLPAPTKTALTSLNIRLVQLLGGTAAVSKAVEDELTAMGITVNRIAGSDRTDTAARIATFAQASLSFSKTHVNLARGDAFADALTGGPHGGKERGVVLLTASATALGAATRQWISERKADLGAGNIFGGEGAVSETVKNEAEAAGGANREVFSVAPQTAETKVASSSATTNEAARECSATVPTGTPSVTIAIFQASNVSKDSSGTRFVDGNRDGIADFTKKTTGAVIERVNGAENPENPDSNEVKSVPASSGQVSFTIDSTSSDDIVAVVYQDQGGDGLNVDANGVAVEPVGTGCRTTFIPPTAPAGSRGVTVDLVNRGADYFTGATTATPNNPNGSPSGSFTYFYDANDTYQFNGVVISQADFEGVLSKSDVVDARYEIDATKSSVFNLTTDRVAAATNVTATNVSGTKDVRIDFTIPPENGPETTYQVFRRTIDPGADGICGSSDDDPLTGNSGVFPATPQGTATNGTFTDRSVPDGCYRYRVRSFNQATGAGANSAETTPSTRVPATVVSAGPKAVVTIFTGVSKTGGMKTGDSFRICFDKVVNPPASATLRMSDLDGSVGDLTQGGNARFERGDPNTSITCGTQQFPGGQVLNVTLTASPSVVSVGSTPGVGYPATIVGATGISDPNGNAFDVANSPDTTIE